MSTNEDDDRPTMTTTGKQTTELADDDASRRRRLPTMRTTAHLTYESTCTSARVKTREP